MVYNLIDWRFEYGAGTIAARPTLINFVKRFGAALLIWFLLYLFYLGFELPSWASATTSSRVLLGIGGVTGAAALANPLSVLWQRLRIERDGCGDTVITSFLFWPRTIRITQGSVASMPVVVTEERVRIKHSRRTVGWRWRVRLEFVGGSVEFWLDQSVSKPAGDSPPGRVKEFILALEAITGVRCMETQVAAWEGRRRGFSLGVRRVTTAGPSTVRRTVGSLDELPPELRAQLEAAAQQARDGNESVVRYQKITVRDSDGRVQTYDSIDDVPLEIRSRLEAARRHNAQRSDGAT